MAKLTPNQLEFKKQQQRLTRAVKRIEKRGYIVPDDIIPKTPKRVTQKALEKIKSFTTNDIYKRSEFIDKSTGEVIKGAEGRKLERSRAAIKGHQTRKWNKIRKETIPKKKRSDEPTPKDFGVNTVINRYKEMINRFDTRATKVLNEWLDDVINRYGAEVTAQTLEIAESNGHTISIGMLLSDGGVQAVAYITAVNSYFNDVTGYEEPISDAMEDMEDWELPF